MSSHFISLSATLPPRRQWCWAWVNCSSASPCLCSSLWPLGWSPSRLLPVPVVAVLFLRRLQSLWLFLGISGWFQPSRRCQALGWQPPGGVREMPSAQFQFFLVASVTSVLRNILFLQEASQSGSVFLLLSRYFHHLGLLSWFHMEISLVTS